MNPSDKKFPARFLFKATALGMATHSLETAAHSGTRAVSACAGGQFEGPRIKGSIVKGQSNEWRMVSPRDPALFGVEGLVLLCTEQGEAVLMKYVGRGSGQYGEDSYRIGVSFEASEGPLEWLNEILAVAYVNTDGADLHFEVHELLGRPAADSGFLDVEPLYAVTMNGVIGERFKINGLVTNRYCSVAAANCVTEGRINSQWLPGYVSGAHRTSRTPSSFPWHLDYKIGMQTDDGTSIYKHCIGTISREHAGSDPDADHTWRTSAVYETQADGPINWLNGIVALGVGWGEGEQVKHLYYELL